MATTIPPATTGTTRARAVKEVSRRKRAGAAEWLLVLALLLLLLLVLVLVVVVMDISDSPSQVWAGRPPVADEDRP